MKILKLKKRRLEGSHSLVTVTYKEMFSTIKRDVIKGRPFWMWCDTGHPCLNDTVLDAFYESGDYELELNTK